MSFFLNISLFSEEVILNEEKTTEADRRKIIEGNVTFFVI